MQREKSVRISKSKTKRRHFYIKNKMSKKKCLKKIISNKSFSFDKKYSARNSL